VTRSPTDRRHLVLVALGYVSGLLMLSRSAGPGVRLVPWGLVGGTMIALLLPTAAAVNYLVFRRVSGPAPNADPDLASGAAIGEIGFRITAFEIVLHWLILLNLAGAFGSGSMVPARLVVVFFGVLLIGIGDLLPRTRPNLAIGVRTPLMLKDRNIWMQMHRIAGYAAVGLGAVIVLAGIFLGHPEIAQVINAAAIVAMTLMAWAYRRLTRPRVAR
jgi:hypothetical protein